MWTWLTGILANKALLWSVAKYAAILFVGYVVGTWFGGFGDYKRGYRAGYQDGKAGEREKRFPNLFSISPVPFGTDVDSRIDQV